TRLPETQLFPYTTLFRSGETMSGSEGGNPARNFAPRKVQPDGVSLQPSTELAHRRPGLVAAPGVAAGSVLGPGPRGPELLGPRRRARRGCRPGANRARPRDQLCH